MGLGHIRFQEKCIDDLEILKDDYLLNEDENLISNLTDTKTTGEILSWCSNLVKAGDTQYTKELFIEDLKDLVNQHLEFNDLRVDLIMDGLCYLFDQDPEACQDYAAEVLEKEAEDGWYLDDTIREELFSILANDQRLTNIMVNEANNNGPSSSQNIMHALQKSKNNTSRLLTEVFNDLRFDLQHFFEKLRPALSPQDQKSNLTHLDLLNIICRHFDWTQSSPISTQMESWVLKQLEGQSLDISTVPRGQYRDWLTHIHEHPVAGRDASRN
jgi:hypothetical protein